MALIWPSRVGAGPKGLDVRRPVRGSVASIERMIRDTKAAADVVGRVRSLFRGRSPSAPPWT